MKMKINHIFLLFMIALLGFFSCQEEETNIDNPSEQETILANSSLSSLMVMTSSNDGSADDILDGSSCFSVELPVTIVVDDATYVIETLEDLEELEALYNNISNSDVMDFVFPITIIFSDYSEVTIENEDQLTNYITNCNAEENDIIECVDFVYPISFSVFDSAFSLTETIVINSDEELYVFLEDLEDDDNALIVSLNYPVSLEYANGDVVEVNSNQELAEAIELAGDDCNEEDNNCTEVQISPILQECLWNFTDGTNAYANLQMVFYENGELQITEGDTTSFIGGFYNLSSTDNGLVLTISELTAFQDDLGGEWLIIDCGESSDDNPELTITRGDTTLQLQQDCYEAPSCNQSEVSDYLMSCYIVPTINGYTSPMTYFQFSENNSLFTMYQGDMPYSGTWDISTDDDGVFIVINFDPALGDYNGFWYLQECNEEGLVFSQGDDMLILACGEENPFECFGNYDLTACDQDNGAIDSTAEFDLNLIFTNCPNDDVEYAFYLTLQDAEAEVNALPSLYTNITQPEVIYSRVSLASNPSVYEVFSHSLIVEDCSNTCSEEEVDTFLTTCIWNAVNYNGSDNLMAWNFDFEANSQNVIIYNNDTTIDATWTTSQSADGVIVEFSNVTGTNIQAVTGQWLVVECQEDHLELHSGDNILVLERSCD